ncbi:MAG: hypothetical protein F4Y08_05915 [Caldilineaceae bacterium SB0662_bin_9]|uniref:Glycoside hydrolase family 5 domain-containing protein n=1 Tax=Caldilineaceae bacterium SB0662_bin_9 TaxID=2605258 RepID=A0A6B1DT52_9CHLR|nr:hypothetical protein [Caldilineaceae bacterium]MYD89863.1 hypothetical protein [Caldilineaceae bacterium SB0662_bin_9]
MFKEFFDGSLRAVSTVVLVLLAVTVLILPPLNLPARLGWELGLPNLGDNRAHIGPQGGLTTDETRGIAVIFLPEDMTADASVVLTGIPMDSLGNMRGDAARFQAGVDALGMVGLKAKSSLFLIDFRGSANQRATIQMPIPEEITAFERLKLVTWRDGRWQTVPSTIVRSALQIESRLDIVPDNLLLVQDDISLLPDLTLLMSADQLPAPGTAHEVVDRVGVAFSTLRGDGGLEGEIAAVDTSAKPVLLGISNTEPNGTVRADLLINMLSSGGQLQNQSISILDAVREFGFHGLYLNYGGLSLQPEAGLNFTAFVAGLAADLKADDPTHRLIVQVERPQQISEAEWDTLGYDWATLAEFVDQVVIPVPLDPEDFRPGAYPFESLLMYATGRIPRSKLTIALHTASVGVSDTQLAMIPFSSAIGLMKGSLSVDAVGDNLMMQLDRSTLAEEPRYDPILHQYTLTTRGGASGSQKVYVGDATALRAKLGILARHNISNMVLDVSNNLDIDPAVWDAVAEFKSAPSELVAAPAEYRVEFSISLSGEDKAHLWAPIEETSKAFPLQETGTYQVEAVIAIGDQSFPGSDIRTVTVTSLMEPSAQTLDKPVLVPGPGSNIVAHSGPGNNYFEVDVGLTKGKTYEIVGRNNGATWLQIEDETGLVGWVNAPTNSEWIQGTQLLNRLPVISITPEAPPPSPAVDPSTSASALWGYGVQAHMLGGGNLIAQSMLSTKQLGFNWIKQQVRWKDFEPQPGNLDPKNIQDLDWIRTEAEKQGISVLLSVLAAPDWAREAGFDASVVGPPGDNATFARFVGSLATRYCRSSVRAIEVWNEQNLNYEWGNKPINAAEYVQLLKEASAAIRAACPSMLVVSGAPTPTGVRDPAVAIDDLEYLKQMIQVGMLNYVDAVGAHPSGYNVPPQATGQDYCSIIAGTGMTNFNAGCPGNPHRSFSFRSTMEEYRAAVAAVNPNIPIWPTEFGWAVATPPGYRDLGYGYALDNSYQEQADWTVQAYQMMKNWGWVAAPILWNLNFRVVAPGTEREQWGIVNPDWSPLPVYNSLKAMAK